MALGILLTALLTWLSWNTNAPHMGRVLTHTSDPLGYYQFLPGTFMQGDWSTFGYVHYLPNGNGLSLFTMGVAILQAPFFLGAWLYCALVGIPATGFELPFIFARLLAASAYAAFGATVLLSMLLRRYSAVAAWTAVGTVLFATTLYFYTVHEGGMSHVYSFFLITVVIHLTYAMLERSRWDLLLGLMLCVSLIILIRPLNGVVLLFVAFAGEAPRNALLTRLKWLKEHPLAAISGALLSVSIWIPQLVYWKNTTGSWFVFTYGKKNESFDWSDPHFFDTLFSHQNGWFIYTPVMLLAFGMLIWQVWKGDGRAWLILLVWLFVWYVYASWWCWWLGKAFGYRGFIELYALFAFPMAALLERVFRAAVPYRVIAICVLLLLVNLNIRLGHIYQSPWEGPEWTWQRLGDIYLKALSVR